MRTVMTAAIVLSLLTGTASPPTAPCSFGPPCRRHERALGWRPRRRQRPTMPITPW